MPFPLLLTAYPSPNLEKAQFPYSRKTSQHRSFTNVHLSIFIVTKDRCSTLWPLSPDTKMRLQGYLSIYRKVQVHSNEQQVGCSSRQNKPSDLPYDLPSPELRLDRGTGRGASRVLGGARFPMCHHLAMTEAQHITTTLRCQHIHPRLTHCHATAPLLTRHSSIL